jgi:hypothetical protein
MKPNDASGLVERAEHKDDPAVLAHVCHGFNAAARQVKVGHLAAVQDAERIIAFRGNVEETVVREGRGPNEEHLLF